MTDRNFNEAADRHQTIDYVPAAIEAPAEPGPADLPARLGHHVVGPELKHGGMGRIVRVWDEQFKRPLALKLLRGRGDRLEQRLVYEGQLTGCLQHPGIPPVHDQGRLPDGRPYFIMKLIQGASLGELLRRRASPAEELPRFLLIFEQLCEAVGYAHSRQVIHRDLKPGNVMVGAFGEVQLIDWGLAKLMRPVAAAPDAVEDVSGDVYGLTQATALSGMETAEGTALGTPAYMPPEQARGELTTLDARADVFGLGAILCEVLTGSPPYRGREKQGVFDQARCADLSDAWERLAGCGADGDLIALALTCLATERADRPADGTAVARAVAAYRQEVQRRLQAAEVAAAAAAARAEEEGRRRQVERQRRRLAVGLATAVVLLVLGGSGVWVWRQGEEVRQEARRQHTGEALADLLDRCDAALRSNDTGLAQVTLAAAERRLPEPGGETQRTRVERCWADLALLRRLNEIDTIRWTPRENRFPPPKVIAGHWREALAGYGLAAGQGEEAAAARVLGSVLRERLLLVLDLWLGAEPTAWVRGVLRHADADPYREAVRDAVAARDGTLVEDLAECTEALQQPARFAAALGQSETVEAERRREMLETALRARQMDLTLLMALGGLYPINQRDGAEQRVRWYQAAIAAHPLTAAAHNNLGIALRDKKDLEEAIAAFKEAIRLDSHYAAPHDGLGVVLREKLGVEGAIAAFKEAIRLDPKTALRYNGLGAALRDKKDLEGAIAAFKEAIRLDPKAALPHGNLGLALRDKKDLEGAIAAFEEAIRLDPQDAFPHNGLGLALVDKQELEGAIAAFKEAIRLDPKAPGAHNNLGSALEAKKDLKGAIVTYREAIRLGPKDARPHYNLGIALYAKTDVEGAIAAFKEAIRLDPNDSTPHIALGNVLLAKTDVEGAIAAYQEAIRVDPKDARSHLGLGSALYAKKDVEGAVAAYKEAIGLDPKYALPHYGLGNALRAKKDIDGAVAAYKEAVRLDPKAPLLHNTLGTALYEQKDFEGAVAASKEAIRLDPKFIQAHGALGQALLQAGAFAEAREATFRCLKLLPPAHPLHKVVQQQLRLCDQLLALEGKLNAYLDKGDAPSQPQELLNLIALCRAPYKLYHATAARLATVAFTAQPALADNLTVGHRYQAARSAALAAAGQGRDPGKLSAAERTKLRAQALTWLQADLQQWTTRFQDRDPKALPGLATVLPAWQQEAAFAALRDPKERATLAAGEQQDWAKLWADVDQLVKQVVANIRTQRFIGTLTAREKERTHEVKLQAGQKYLIDLESKQFDTYLRLHDGQGKLLAENDDIAPDNLNSRLFFTAPAEGSYRLVAASFEQRGTGSYTLTVRSFVPAKQE